MLVRFLHGAACVFLRSAGGPTKHLRDEIFEACWWNTMMGLIYPWVCVEAGIDHDPVDEVIEHRGDAVDTAEPFVKAGRKWRPRRRCFHWRLGLYTPLETFIVTLFVALLVPLSLAT